jgi:hypothetical protein
MVKKGKERKGKERKGKERKGKETGRAGLNRKDGAVWRCTYVRSISPQVICTCKRTLHM